MSQFNRQQRGPSDGFFMAWFIFCAFLSLAMLGLMAWVAVVLVQWVTTK